MHVLFRDVDVGAGEHEVVRGRYGLPGRVVEAGGRPAHPRPVLRRWHRGGSPRALVVKRRRRRRRERQGPGHSTADPIGALAVERVGAPAGPAAQAVGVIKGLVLVHEAVAVDAAGPLARRRARLARRGGGEPGAGGAAGRVERGAHRPRRRRRRWWLGKGEERERERERKKEREK